MYKKNLVLIRSSPPAERPTPTILKLSCMDRAVAATTLTRRAVEVMSPQWSPLPAVVCPLTGWWASPWTLAAVTSSPVEALTWSTEEIWKGAVTTYRTHHAPPQLWWVFFKSTHHTWELTPSTTTGTDWVHLDSRLLLPNKPPDIAKLSIKPSNATWLAPSEEISHLYWDAD